MKLEIVTPEFIAYSGEADAVILPTVDGEVGILPGHIPLVTLLEAGEIEVIRKGSREFLTIDRGFAEVVTDQISVITEAAIDVQDIDPKAAEEAERRAREELEKAKDQNMDPADLERLEGSFRFAIAKKLAAGRRRGY